MKDQLSCWGPVETAPAGTPILVTDGQVVIVAMRDKTAKTVWHPVGFDGDDWWWHFNCRDLTHWMRLPDLPSKS